jgi:hypothetical protein
MAGWLSQFELSTYVRCRVTDGEGFGCSKGPSHQGPHVWSRCDSVDSRGHRCTLTPRHPGDHALTWYDRPAVRGDVHTTRYPGTLSETTALADAAVRAFTRYGWVEMSRSFQVGFLWRRPQLAQLLWLATAQKPAGRMTVVYEYRP